MTATTRTSDTETAALTSEVARSADFSAIRYSQSWEDPRCLERALTPGADDTILSIAAAGDNSFALLLQGAGRVVSVDMSPAQCALVELKRAAILTLEHDELLRFLGATVGSDRTSLYQRVRSELAPDARAFWDPRPELIVRGVLHVGKLEGMFRTFRTRVLPLLHSSREIAAVFVPRDRAGREAFWEQTWNNRRWRAVIRLFFSEPVIARLGRDPAFFAHVDIKAGEHYSARAFHAFVELDPTTNPFLQYMLLGRYVDLETGHPYLAQANHALLRERLDRLEVINSELEAWLGTCQRGAITGFNLSDIFEWMSDDLHTAMYGAIIRAASVGATMAYWNNLVPRSVPAAFAAGIAADRTLARELHAADRAFLYRDFHVEHVTDPGVAA